MFTVFKIGCILSRRHRSQRPGAGEHVSVRCPRSYCGNGAGDRGMGDDETFRM